MKDKRIYYTLLLIVAVGITITTCTNYFLENSSKTKASAELAYEKEMEGEIMAFSDTGQEAAMQELMEDDTLLENGVISEENQDAWALGLSEEGLPEDSGQKKRSMDSEALGRASKEMDSDFDTAKSGEVQTEDRFEAAKAEAVLISPLETAPIKADSPTDAQGKVLAEEAAKASYYRNRLSDLEAQIQKNRENQGSFSNNSSAKNMASNELKLWDSELNAIYDEILEHLDEKQAGNLVAEEREWMKERDRIAAEASKAVAGASLESVEYIASQAESTKLRAYELLDEYEYLLID